MMISKCIKWAPRYQTALRYALVALSALLPVALASPARAQSATALPRLIHWNTVTLDTEAVDPPVA